MVTSLVEMKNPDFVPLAIVALLMVAAAPLSGGEQATEEEARPPTHGAVDHSQRFEGYAFADVDGNPLPFQSDEEIAEFLLSADVESMEKIPVGVSSPKKLILAGRGIRANAVFKYIDREEKNVRDRTAGKSQFHLVWRDWFGYDIAAYQVDRLLELDRVPPIVRRKVKRHEGSVQIWLQGTITEHERRKRGIEPPDIARFNQQKEIMHVFDNLVANRDSNLGNSLIDGNWRLWLIDCSRCFGTSKELLYPKSTSHCERRLWQKLQELTEEEAHARLAPYLTKTEINALLARRDKLVEHFQALIDEWGEPMIIFDDRPPSETAPWAAE